MTFKIVPRDTMLGEPFFILATCSLILTFMALIVRPTYCRTHGQDHVLGGTGDEGFYIIHSRCYIRFKLTDFFYPKLYLGGI